jgi:hypothetical protein
MSRCYKENLVNKGERIQRVAIFQRERQRKNRGKEEVSGNNQQPFFAPKERRRCKLSSLCGQIRGSQRDGVYLWLTNSALVYEPKCGVGGGGDAGPQPMSAAVHMEPK